MKKFLLILLILIVLLTSCACIYGDDKADANWLVKVPNGSGNTYYYCQNFSYKDDGSLMLSFKDGTELIVVAPLNVTIEKVKNETSHLQPSPWHDAFLYPTRHSRIAGRRIGI